MNKETISYIRYMIGVAVAVFVAASLQRITGWIAVPWAIGGVLMALSIWLFRVSPEKRTAGRLVAIAVATAATAVAISLVLHRVLASA